MGKAVADQIPTPAERRERVEAIADAFLAFAAMMKENYEISKEAAVLSIAAAYDANAQREKK